MDIRVFPSGLDASLAGAEQLARALRGAPRFVLGLATGSTPVPLYRELIRRNRAGELDFAHVETFNLDEYVGLGPDHPQSFRRFMDENLFHHIDIDPARTHVPRGDGPDPEADARSYDAAIAAAGGIDLQVLGVGRNGHIGFNEPDAVFHRATHLVQLSDSTIDANQRFFASRDEVPRRAITLGMGGILGAREILLFAFGAEKADAVRGICAGEIDPRCPGSLLQLHPNVTLLLDEAAASQLP